MSKRSGLLRILMTMLGCVLAFGLVIGLNGCGKRSDEDLIRSTVTELMDTFKNPTKENLKQFVDGTEIDLSELDQYGVDIYEFLQHSFAKFDYKINDIKVEDDTAIVALSLTNVDLKKAVTAALEEYMVEADEEAVVNAEDPAKEAARQLFTKVYQKLDESEDLVTTEATLELNKQNGEWEIDKESMNAVISGMYGGMEI